MHVDPAVRFWETNDFSSVQKHIVSFRFVNIATVTNTMNVPQFPQRILT